jgi:hypothetical protein
MAINTRKYITGYLKIKTKDAKVIPLRLNKAQEKVYKAIQDCYTQGKPPRLIVLKARQVGISTMTGAVIFKNCATEKNVKAGIIAHKEDSSTALFNMYKLFYQELPPVLRPARTASNAKEIVFNTKFGGGLNSSIRCHTAGADGVARGETYQYMHISEYAFWGNNKEDVLLGLLQTVPKTPDTLVVIESTANGFDDFRRRWIEAVSGRSDYTPIFTAWHEMEEYRLPYDGSPLTAVEDELKAVYGLDNEQIAWRRSTIANECGGDINKFRQEYPACPEEAFIASGNTYFDKDAVISRINALEAEGKTYIQGEFEYELCGDRIDDSSIRFIEGTSDLVRIYKKPIPGRPYVLGGDTAGEGSDRSIAQVLDNTNAEQCAVLAGNIDEDIYTQQVYCLGKYYNNALVGIESNFNTYQNKTLAERLNYSHMYLREEEDRITRRIKQQYGVRTDSATRPIMLAELRQVIRDSIYTINDYDTLQEALTFVINDRGRPEAMQGEHDDRIMALAIAHYIRPRQSCKAKEPEEQKKEPQLVRKGKKWIINY